jgi:hypothetical protein
MICLMAAVMMEAYRQQSFAFLYGLFTSDRFPEGYLITELPT